MQGSTGSKKEGEAHGTWPKEKETTMGQSEATFNVKHKNGKRCILASVP